MIRLYIICEGQTEEEFVNNLLYNHFLPRNIYPIPILIGTGRHKGGNIKYQRLQRNVRNILRQEDACYCTVLIDYYRLPTDFPGKRESKSKGVLSDIAAVFCTSMESALQRDIGGETL